MENKRKELFHYLRRGPRTSRQIELYILTVAAGSMIADLRKKGCDIRSEYIGRSQMDSQLWRYELLSWPKDIKFKVRKGVN